LVSQINFVPENRAISNDGNINTRGHLIGKAPGIKAFLKKKRFNPV
jgi:hypothetical protein